MPSKKYTAQKRAEMQAQKEKMARRGYPEQKDSKMLMILVTLIIIIVIAVGAFLVINNGPPTNIIDIITNTGPTANTDTVYFDKNTESNTIDVLGNDVDVDNDELTIIHITSPLHGTAEISDGTILYTPELDYTGEDSLIYTINDGLENSSAAVNITIIELNPYALPG